MEEENRRNDGIEKPEKYGFFSRVVKAGRRTYFFDVRATQENDLYLTISESKKIYDKDGRIFFEKRKIFLYQEDFDAFYRGLGTIITYIKNSKDGGFMVPLKHTLVKNKALREMEINAQLQEIEASENA